MGTTPSQTRPKMLKQDRPVNQAYGGPKPGSAPSTLRILSSSQRKCEKDGNFNFLGQDDSTLTGDENRNQMRPRALGLLGRDAPISANHYGPGPLSPLSRLPCWSPLEPLPEIESGDDTGGRVPPDGAEEGKIDEEMRRVSDDEKEKSKELVKGREQEQEEQDEDEEGEEGIYWDDSDEEFEFSYRSGSSSPLSIGSGDVAGGDSLNSIWDRVCVGGSNGESVEVTTNPDEKQKQEEDKEKNKEAGVRRKSRGSSSMLEEASSDTDSDPSSELPDLMEAVWTLQDRERFKAQEMEKHQAQLTMYRRLALIRWVRTLQGRVQEQQNRLQSSFDIILTHRKELLRMGAAAASQ
ncbi:UPF0500 protein C1orf216 homolog isoform X2 [Astyanax mexicanus]|uniref:Uncharacterized protein n=1 Tax=Astyanax mexicanus TaxID=7994 RepID=A0A3B1IF42_ASTMX|nr:UPF0500 protein C1orf216 homolog isoform X2 [Astyanax mexicanus]